MVVIFRRIGVVTGIVITLFACQKSTESFSATEKVLKTSLTEEELYDKVLGSLVGSAIGDAMGAPTEMWSRYSIETEYGFVEGLDSMVREVSPEGTWKSNLQAGGTTDDTRWKKLVFEFFSKQEPTAANFSAQLVKEYQTYLDQYKKIDSFDPKPFEENTLRVAWLQEWAKVAKPYAEGDFLAYQNALAKFYGGEMVCAGLLYAPAVGVFYPENPKEAYNKMMELSLFDLGFAKDISALSAAMTAAAMKKDATRSDVLSVLREIDPEAYFESRLVGRTSFRLYRTALYLVKEANGDRSKAFELLDKYQQDMPFHAAEIYVQVLTAMLFADFDFMATMQFLVNYGRDNDTTAAVAGGILGAFYGFNALPVKESTLVLEVSKNELEMDLVQLSKRATRKIIP